ncbi:MAG TPA: hypothetical protein VJ553_01455 [Candidatus Paceibacterota bacterium]|nr:hypothetical protein [Candidatus Paceibacterota bacterium]
MNIIDEIHRQKPIVRYTLFVLSTFVVLSAAGLAWFTDFERDAYFALHEDPADRAEFIAQQEERIPQPLAAIGRGIGSLAASIGSLIGFDKEAGFETRTEYDTVHLLPLSR